MQKSFFSSTKQVLCSAGIALLMGSPAFAEEAYESPKCSTGDLCTVYSCMNSQSRMKYSVGYMTDKDFLILSISEKDDTANANFKPINVKSFAYSTNPMDRAKAFGKMLDKTQQMCEIK